MTARDEHRLHPVVAERAAMLRSEAEARREDAIEADCCSGARFRGGWRLDPFVWALVCRWVDDAPVGERRFVTCWGTSGGWYASLSTNGQSVGQVRHTDLGCFGHALLVEARRVWGGQRPAHAHVPFLRSDMPPL